MSVGNVVKNEVSVSSVINLENLLLSEKSDLTDVT